MPRTREANSLIRGLKDTTEGSTYDDNDHASGGLSSDKPSTAGQDDDSHRDGDDSEVELSIRFIRRHHDQELDSESKEEKEIELEKGDVDLITASDTLGTKSRNQSRSYLIS